jgi:YQGE family putative transporter
MRLTLSTVPVRWFGAVPPERRLSADAVLTLWLQGLFTFGSVMAGTFLNLYLWRLTESLWVNGMYNIIVFLFTGLSFLIGGKLTKTRGKMVAVRLGIGLTAAFFLAVVAAGNLVADYYAAFAVFSGVAGGFYWIGFWTLLYDVSTETNRIRFVGLNTAVSTIFSLAGPVAAGAVFSFFGDLGYMIVFGVGFAVFLITALLSFRIHAAPARRTKYYLRHAGFLLRSHIPWRKALYGNVVIGMMQGVLMFLPQILLYHVLKQEDRVSYLSAVLSGLSIAVSYLFSRLARSEKVRRYILLSSLGYLFGALLLLIDLSLFTVIGFMVLHTICNPIKSNAFDAYFYKLIGTLPMKGKLRTEAMVVRELCWNVGRIAVVLLLIVLADDLSAPWLPWVIIQTSAVQFVLLFFVEKERDPAVRHARG